MAIGGIVETFEYVLEGDRDLDEKLQTVFHVKRMSLHERNKLAAEAGNKRLSKTGRTKKLSPSDADFFDREAWPSIVEKVENYFIPVSSEDSVLSHFKLNDSSEKIMFKVVNKNLEFFRIDSVADEKGLDIIRKMMTPEQVNEVIEFSESIGTLTANEKKD